ncbi:hypothetical protein AN958_10442 [Leucoagaricus sp. SymC.cos]|nr:hypothetical protein AN958_10442 [Leucoagaricus sp. SymC.cos]
MTSRPVVSYDDMTLPYDAPSKRTNSHPPSKKRKRNNHKKQPAQPTQHWDNPVPAQDADEEEAMDNEESRVLTQEEIWDDSALIDAWNAAMEEYEAYHGPDKGWKNEPVHKSPLWYNVPPKNPPKKKSTPAVVAQHVDEPDSKPIDFDTFVPVHDASLSAAATTAVEEDASQTLYEVPLTYQPDVSQDEAFQRAVQASYWSGYWTAVYYCRQAQSKQSESTEAEAQQGLSSSGEEDEEGEEFVSTQR